MRWCLGQGFWRKISQKLRIVIGTGVGIRKGFMEKVGPVTTVPGFGTIMGKNWILDLRCISISELEYLHQ